MSYKGITYEKITGFDGGFWGTKWVLKIRHSGGISSILFDDRDEYERVMGTLCE